MLSTIRSFIIATTLAAAIAPAALAGGMSASLQGPAKDGVTYTVITYSCSGSASMRPSGWAEGVVKGERRTVPLVLEPAPTAGRYILHRTWPRDGHWLVRLTFANPNSPALLAQIGHDGRVGDSKFLWNDDGKHECETMLAAVTR